MSSSALPEWLVQALLTLGFLGLVYWALPDVLAWLGAREIQTSARAQCPRPAEFETLVIFVTVGVDGRVRVQCGPVGAGAARAQDAHR